MIQIINLASLGQGSSQADECEEQCNLHFSAVVVEVSSSVADDHWSVCSSFYTLLSYPWPSSANTYCFIPMISMFTHWPNVDIIQSYMKLCDTFAISNCVIGLKFLWRSLQHIIHNIVIMATHFRVKGTYILSLMEKFDTITDINCTLPGLPVPQWYDL